jgi:hypothetical protein
MEENALPDETQQSLRASGLISEQEVAYKQGDLLVAVNVITQERRALEKIYVAEGCVKRRLLKG